MQPVVVVVSEEESFVAEFASVLEEQGKTVWRFNSITLAMPSFADARCSMIVVCVPELDDTAIKLIANLKSIRNAPIFVCYRIAAEQQRMAALNRGATVCVSQEHSFRECSAMIDALIRIYHTIPNKEGSEVLSFRNGLVINTLNWSVWINGTPIKLTRREYLALRFLAQNNDRVLSRREIYCNVWQTQEDYEIDGCVKSLIKSLRKKIGDNQYQIVQNVRGVGYRLKDD